jgi:hypothetical protein
LIQFRRVSYWDDYVQKSVVKPKCIITEFDRNSLASPMILSARKHNILTITLTHGVIEYGFTPLLADHILCWGKCQKERLISLGVEPYRISVTGNPMIKVIERCPGKKTRSSNNVKVCLAIGPEAEYLNKSLIEAFDYAVEQLEQVEGIIKLHPTLKRGNYKWINSISSKVIIFDSLDITNSELFNIIDLLIVHFSGIANEALAAGTPVVLLQPTGSLYLNVLQTELNQKAGCKIAANTKDLIEILDEVIANPDLFRIESIKKSKEYLENLFEFIGDESVRVMISEIDRLSGESDSI